MDFRTRLREQIEYLGLLDKEVTAKAGITKRALDSYVGSQNCMPSADIAVKLAKALNVSVEYLVTGKDFYKLFPLPAQGMEHLRSSPPQAELVQPRRMSVSEVRNTR